MDEAAWLACTDPTTMLAFLNQIGGASNRKVRLFACTCCRRVWNILSDKRSQIAVGVAERYADGEVEFEEWFSTHHAASVAHLDIRAADLKAAVVFSPFSPTATNFYATLAPSHALNESAFGAANASSRCAAHAVAAAAGSESIIYREMLAQVVLLSDVFCNPFHPIVFDPAWRTPTVAALATAAYEERSLPTGTLDPARLAVLADALEDAGCTNLDILAHCRDGGLHVRGCWVVDLLLGKS
jgi:hypothetical protein